MSTISEEFNNGNAAQFNRDTKKTFLGIEGSITADFTNADDEAVVLPEGTVMGRLHATGKIVPLTSAATDGSQFPVGILLGDHTVDAADTATLTVVTGGSVAEECLILQGSDTLDTVITARRIRDRIAFDTLGIRIVKTADDLTGYDNDLV